VSPRKRSQGSIVRSYATWLLSHGLQRRALKVEARRGVLTALLAIDPKTSADPFATYEQLRGPEPIQRGPVVSATVDHAAANQILRSEDFGTAAGHAELPPFLRRLLERVADPYALSPVDKPSLLALDPPDHTRHRKLVARAFTARRITALEDRVTSVAESLLDQLAEEAAAGAGSFDLVERYAARLPVAVIADLLGVPSEQHDWLLDWGNRAAITLDPGLTFRQFRDAENALRRMHHWFDDHVAQLRRNPGDDLLSQLALIDGDDALTDLELRAIGLLVLGAGFETTVNLIGNAVVDLAAHRDQLDLLIAEPERWPNAVEEVLRYDSPVQITVRSALRDTEIAGTQIPEGLGILVLLGGVNRDPKVFADPQRFDVTRTNPDQHLSFSAGVHFCLGASLARLEAVTALRTLYTRFPDLTLAEPPVRRRTRVLHGYEEIRVATGATVSA
jgi:cytochrome P450